MQHIWIAITLAALVIAISGCPKKEAVDASKLGTSNVEQSNPVADAEEGFIPEPMEEPLAGSPLNLWGLELGTRLDAHNDNFGDNELDLTQQWREGELTGIQWRKLQAGAEGTESDTDISYFHNGELVGSQRMVTQSEAEFEAKAAVLDAKYGNSVQYVPAFIADSLIYGDLAAGDPEQLMFWVDKGTRTAIAGRYDSNEGTSMWLLFHPERFDAAQGDTFAGMGS